MKDTKHELISTNNIFQVSNVKLDKNVIKIFYAIQDKVLSSNSRTIELTHKDTTLTRQSFISAINKITDTVEVDLRDGSVFKFNPIYSVHGQKTMFNGEEVELKSSVTIAVSYDVYKHILQGNFFKSSHTFIKVAKSKHSMNLYEMLKLRLQDKTKDSFTYKRDTLVDLLATSKTSKEWNRFSQNVLKPSIEEINEKSDINLSIDIKRIANQVKSVTFNVSLKSVKTTLRMQPHQLAEKVGDEKAHEVFDGNAIDDIEFIGAVQRDSDTRRKEEVLQGVCDELINQIVSTIENSVKEYRHKDSSPKYANDYLNGLCEYSVDDTKNYLAYCLNSKEYNGFKVCTSTKSDTSGLTVVIPKEFINYVSGHDKGGGIEL